MKAKVINVISKEIDIGVTNIDYEDILANLDDYEYPYNHINREGV